MTKEKLIQLLIHEGYLKSSDIIQAFEKMEREYFVPAASKEYAYENRPLPLPCGKAVISQPLTVAFMLELLDPREGEKILEIGTGSGWQTALLAYCVCPTRFKINEEEENKLNEKNVGQILCGSVISIDRETDCKKYAEANLKKYEIENEKIIALLCRDGLRGYKKESPYDKIIASVAINKIPHEWKSSLKVGGRMVFPMRQSIYVIEKTGKNSFSEKSYFGFSFQKLISG